MSFDLACDITLPAAVDAADADEQATILGHFGAPSENSIYGFVDVHHVATVLECAGKAKRRRRFGSFRVPLQAAYQLIDDRGIQTKAVSRCACHRTPNSRSHTGDVEPDAI